MCVLFVLCRVSLCTAHRAHTPPWTWYNMLPHHRIVHNDVLLPTVFINVTSAGLKCKLWWSWTETCRSNFNLRFNVNFSGLWDWYRVHLLVNEGLWWYKIKLDTTHYLFCCDWSVYVTSLWRRGLTFPTHMTRTVLSDRASWYCTMLHIHSYNFRSLTQADICNVLLNLGIIL